MVTRGQPSTGDIDNKSSDHFSKKIYNFGLAIQRERERESSKSKLEYSIKK
jgi:hypothetical protein